MHAKLEGMFVKLKVDHMVRYQLLTGPSPLYLSGQRVNRPTDRPQAVSWIPLAQSSSHCILEDCQRTEIRGV